VTDLLQHFAAVRAPRGREACGCCEGSGSHGVQGPCVRCAGTGFTGTGSDEPWCPSREDDQPAPKRRHWRQPKTALSHDDLDQHLENWFHPDQLEAPTQIHPKSGYAVHVGRERRISRPPEGQDEGPAYFNVREHPSFESRKMFPEHVGTEPIKHVYRGMHVDEWAQAQKQGHIKSDQRGTIADWEGTNADVDPRSAVSYLPSRATGVIAKIRVHPDDGWFVHRADSYVRTRKPIPLDRVEAVSPPITKGGKYGGSIEHIGARQREGDERAFGDYTMRYHTEDQGERRPRHVITTHHPKAGQVGELNWYGTTGTIHHLDVDEDHTRKGIATAMWNWGQEMSPRPKHSGDRTTQGRDWAKAVGGSGLRKHKGALPMPGLRNPHTGGDEWFHGTRAHPEELSEHGFTDPMEMDEGAYSQPESETEGTHWNALLGTHFTADHDIAKEFALGEHSSGANQRGGEEPYRGESRNVLHARLGLHNPKQYASEHDMDHEAYEHEWKAGNHPSEHIPVGSNDEDERYEMEDMWNTADRLHRQYKNRKIPRSADEGGHPTRTSWINSHPDKWGIANRFRERLKAQGHDGIIYGNEYERSKHGEQANKSAIVFHPHQIQVTQHHGAYADHLSAEEGEHQQARLPGAHQMELPFERVAVRDEDDSKFPMTLYRGEGSHDRPSHYPKGSGDAGGWWTSNPESAHRYARGEKGSVYKVDVERHEVEPRGAPGNYFIKDPAVRARRTLHEGAARQMLHRGISVEMSPDDITEAYRSGGHPAVHDLIRQHVDKHLGEHWTSREDMARTFAHPLTHQARTVVPSPFYMHVPVVMHGSIAKAHHEQDPDKLRGAMVEGHGWQGLTHKDEQETLVKPGAPVRVHHMEAALPDRKDWPEHLDESRWENDGLKAWESEPHSWQHIGGAGEHTAARRKPLQPGQEECWKCGVRDSKEKFTKASPYAPVMGLAMECKDKDACRQRRESGRTAAWTPTQRIFGPTYGLDHRLFDGERLRPAVRDTLMGRLAGVLSPVLGPDWNVLAHAWLAGSQASKWTGPDLEGNGDLDVLIGLAHSHARLASPSLASMGDQDIERHLNTILQARFNQDNWHPPFDPDGKPYDLTGYVNHVSDIRRIKPYAAYDLTDDDWAVKPPELPDWSASQFPQGPAVIAEARALIGQVRAILKLPEPFRTQEATRIWDSLHEARGADFSEHGLGWQGTGNVLEKALDQASGNLVKKLKMLKYAPGTTPMALAHGMTTADLGSHHG
jgi:hypothetical protein